MKILITILISLFISLPSFANPDGKGIICEEEDKYKKLFYFDNGTVVAQTFFVEKDKVVIASEVALYSTSITHINWFLTGKLNVPIYGKFTLDRKTLILKQTDFNYTKSLLQCEIVGADVYRNKINKLKNDYQKELDLILKENKI